MVKLQDFKRMNDGITLLYLKLNVLYDSESYFSSFLILWLYKDTFVIIKSLIVDIMIWRFEKYRCELSQFKYFYRWVSSINHIIKE